MAYTVTLTTSGLSAAQLQTELAAQQISLNSHALTLFKDPRFHAMPAGQTSHLRIVTIGELGLIVPATLPAIFQRAQVLGLQPCPLALAVDLRLQWQTQVKSTNSILSKHEAPQGAITVMSPIEDDDPDLPKGFYLRRINDTLWLRGYRCDDRYIWQPTDTLAFLQPAQ
ncbi:hypothetical protein [Levilactobacillus enshiensis]|uniref:hypothetical protein n=1 Tax=Levilactobacillus enshiensis TaxID=2590213 RepID=UPI001CDCD70E|nr:hypothetical protein [Levilactobacillus enshiensis]